MSSDHLRDSLGALSRVQISKVIIQNVADFVPPEKKVKFRVASSLRQMRK